MMLMHTIQGDLGVLTKGAMLDSLENTSSILLKNPECLDFIEDDFLELLLVLVQSLKLPPPNDRAASL